MIALKDAFEKLATLSEERVKLIVSLIEDLAELEARQDAEDLAAAKEALARVEAGEKTYSLEEVTKRLDKLRD